MIVRTWHGTVPLEKAEGFYAHLMKTGIAEAKALPGNLGAYIYSQPQDQYSHFWMVSYWDSIEAIKVFSGPTPHVAVTYPDDDQYGLISDPIVLHHEVQNVPDEFPLMLK